MKNRTNGAVVIAISDPPPEKTITLEMSAEQFVAFHVAAWLAADGDLNAWCLEWLASGARADLQSGTIELLEAIE